MAFLGAKTVQRDRDIACFAYLDGWDAGATGRAVNENDDLYQGLAASWETGEFGEGGPLKGSAAGLVAEIAENADSFGVQGMAPELARTPMLIISASRANGAFHEPLVSALRSAGATDLSEVILEDDHSFSAHRIELAERLVDWQRASRWL